MQPRHSEAKNLRQQIIGRGNPTRGRYRPCTTPGLIVPKPQNPDKSVDGHTPTPLLRLRSAQVSKLLYHALLDFEAKRVSYPSLSQEGNMVSGFCYVERSDHWCGLDGLGKRATELVGNQGIGWWPVVVRPLDVSGFCLALVVQPAILVFRFRLRCLSNL
jgi:hypothetical protein